jgi:hypothetical protein
MTLQMYWQGDVRGTAQVGELRKYFLRNHDIFFIEYDCFGRDPRRAQGRDGLAFP